MLPRFIVKDFVKKFIATEGQKANVCIKHILYGDQKINNCVLHPFVDEERIGLTINEEIIYITMDELSSLNLDNAKYVITSKVMELHISIL